MVTVQFPVAVPLYTTSFVTALKTSIVLNGPSSGIAFTMNAPPRAGCRGVM
jgi:hypothetical protein